MAPSNESRKPVVVITGSAGEIGSALARALENDYQVVGLDLSASDSPVDAIEIDLTSDRAVELALRKLRDSYGTRIASVVHLAAYFDFTGQEHPLYERLNVDGTKRLLQSLQDFDVEQVVYAGTMLVHAPCVPGARIDEAAPIAPKWAYPNSKAAAEEAIREHHGDIPYVLLHIAGLYDDRTAVPTLAHQIARIYERAPKSHFFAGDPNVGQAMVHKDDVIEAFRRAIDRRADLDPESSILIGEPDAMGYGELQRVLGELIHGEADWATETVPKVVAKAGAMLEEAAEPVVPDVIDQGEKPFIRPFMIEMADDHYALDVSRARRLLGWEPRHDLRETLPRIVDNLKADPHGWYEANDITPPRWLEIADAAGEEPEDLRHGHERRFRDEHRRYIWAHFLNLGLGAWLMSAPWRLGYGATTLAWSDLVAGAAVIVLSLLSLSWRLAGARWATAAVGMWLMFAPLAFWTPMAAAYLSGTLVGALVIGFAVLVPPTPGISIVAARSGPVIPPGWEFSPSSWFQRLPIIFLAVVGFLISYHLAAYQLGHIDGAWEPFFVGAADGKNGTEEIITSWVSHLWPVSDAGLGALTYMLEILTGIIGSTRRWRTMPWLVLLFGFLIVPLGAVSITFIIIQPILLGTWCTLCLVAAAAMLLQIPYSLDELVATLQFLRRRKRAGRSVLRVLVVGDTDDHGDEDNDAAPDDFERSPRAIMGEMLGGGVAVPWTLALSVAVGVWLMLTSLTVGAEGGVADADHLVGALALTVAVTAFAEVARPVRFLNIPLGAVLLVTPFVFAAEWPAMLSSLASGGALIVLSVHRGSVRYRYGGWNRLIV